MNPKWNFLLKSSSSFLHVVFLMCSSSTSIAHNAHCHFWDKTCILLCSLHLFSRSSFYPSFSLQQSGRLSYTVVTSNPQISGAQRSFSIIYMLLRGQMGGTSILCHPNSEPQGEGGIVNIPPSYYEMEKKRDDSHTGFWRFLLEYSHDISPSPPLAKESCMVMPECKEMEKFNQMCPWKKTWRYLVNGPNDCHRHNVYSHHSMQLASRYQPFLQSLRISYLNPYGSWHSPTWNVSLRRHESRHKHWFKARQTCIWAWAHASWVISEKSLNASCLSFLICKIRRMVLTVWFRVLTENYW